MRMASHWTYAGWFTVLRLYAGAFWLTHGVPKFLNGASFMPPSGFMPMLVSKAAQSQTGFYHNFLVGTVIPNITLFAELVRLGEVLVGCSLLLGIFTRFGGLVGCFLALNYMAAQGEFKSWTTIGSLDAAAFVLSFLMLVVPAGRLAGVDSMLYRRPVRTGPVIVPEVVEEPPTRPPSSEVHMRAAWYSARRISPAVERWVSG